MVNVIVSTYENKDMVASIEGYDDCLCTPDRGNVAFGSGKD